MPVYILNAGFGPFQTQKQLLKVHKTLEKVEYITVRDEISFNLLKGIEKPKLYQTIDPVVFLDYLNPINHIKQDCIGVSVMDIRLAEYSEEEYHQYLMRIHQISSFLLNEYDKKIFFFCTEQNDLVALFDLKNLILKKEDNIAGYMFEDEVSVDALKNIYSSIDALVGTRMHSMIISFSQSIPFLGISWQDKVLGFAKMISNEEFIVSIDNPINKEIDKKLLNTFMKDLSNVKDKFIQKKEDIEPYYEINKKIVHWIEKESSNQ